MAYELEEHRISTHNFMEQEFSLRRAKEKEKPRKRTRAPYRKAHAA